MPRDLEPDQFDSEVKASAVPVLLDFWGPQCKPCIALNPTVAELENAYAGQLKVIKVNAPDHRQLCIDLKVLGLPTFIVFKDGDQVARLSRSMISDQELTDWVTAKVPK
jgi:thioredoxin 1